MISNDNKIYICINAGIIEAKKMLVEANNITLPEIVRIANDAVYINRPSILEHRVFDNIEFKVKSINHVCLRLMNKLFITFKSDENGLDIDVKGIGDNKRLHGNYMLSFIATLVNTVERAGIDDGIRLLSDFYKRYTQLQLPIGFYREFNSGSAFRIKTGSRVNNYFVSDSTNLDINIIDINYNAEVIRDLWTILFEKKRIG